MRLSKRGEYALRALIDFGIAQELGKSLLTVNELVEKERLPVKFLEQIFLQLRRAGYLDTKRGSKGGFFLKKRPEEIRFGEVVRLIDGPLAPIGCVSATQYERCTCPDEVHCGLRILMLDVRNAIARILDNYTLADIVEVTLRKIRRDKVPLPFIVDEFFGTAVGAPLASLSENVRNGPLPKKNTGVRRDPKAPVRLRAGDTATKPPRGKQTA